MRWDGLLFSEICCLLFQHNSLMLLKNCASIICQGLTAGHVSNMFPVSLGGQGEHATESTDRVSGLTMLIP